MIRVILVSFIAFAVSEHASAQQDTTTLPPDDLPDNVLEEATQSDENPQLVESLEQLREHPLDINLASAETLMQLPWIDALTARNILAGRKEHPFESLRELLRIDGMTERMFRKIRPYIAVARGASFPLTLAVRSRSKQTLNRSTGFLTNAYSDSPLNQYVRVIAEQTSGDDGTLLQDIRGGILTTKDAGEPRYPDFVTAYVGCRIAPIRTNLILGDYSVEAGQGLVLWRSVGFGKSSEVMTSYRKTGTGVRPYASSDEEMFYRGIAIDVDGDWYRLLIAYSSKPLHATADSTGSVTSLYTTGLFRTDHETAKRNALHEELTALRCEVKPLHEIKIGVSGWRGTYDRRLRLPQLGDEQVSSLAVRGIDLSYSNSGVDGFTEVASDAFGNTSSIGGLTVQPHRRIRLAIVGRSYGAEFFNLRGFAFGEHAGPPRAERGIYVSVSAELSRRIRLSAYLDQFTIPLTPSFPVQVDGHDQLFVVDADVTNATDIQFLFRNRRNPVPLTAVDSFGRDCTAAIDQTLRLYRLVISTRPSARVSLQNRMEINTVTADVREKGILLYQDICWEPIHVISLSVRMVFFHTDSYASRVYQFESDVPGTFSNPPLYGRGIRWYILAGIDVVRNVHVALKFSRIAKENVKSIGTGLDEIQGDAVNSFTLQLDYHTP